MISQIRVQKSETCLVFLCNAVFFSAVITRASVLLNKFAVCKDLAGWLAMSANCAHHPHPRHFWQPPRCLWLFAWKQTCHTLHTKQLLLCPAAAERKAQTYSPEIFSVKVDQSWEDIAIHWAPDNEENICRRLVVVNAWLHCPTCNWFAAHYKQLKTLRQHLYNLIDSTLAVSVFFLGFHLFGRSELLCLLYNQTCFLFHCFGSFFSFFFLMLPGPLETPWLFFGTNHLLLIARTGALAGPRVHPVLVQMVRPR